MIRFANRPKSTVDAGETLDWRTRSVTYAIRQDFSYRETIDDCANHIATILEPMVLEVGDDKRGEKKTSYSCSLSSPL